MIIKGKRYYIKWSYVNRVCVKGVALFGFAVMCGAVGAMLVTGSVEFWRIAVAGASGACVRFLPIE
jgi:hypothetical protein